jgi:hypothetical protein
MPLNDFMKSSLPGLSPQQLRRAADLKEKIESLQGELDRVLSGSGSMVRGRKAGKRRRNRMSAAGRARIAAAARARWARFRAGQKKK